MRAGIGPVLVFVVGAVTAQLALFGSYLDYVKPTQGPWLVVAGGALAALGLVGMLSEQPLGEQPLGEQPLGEQPLGEQPLGEQPAGDQHGHRRVPRGAFLLVLPLVVALGVSPPPLGAFTAARSGAAVPAPAARRSYPPLPAGDPVPLAVHDYAERAAWDGGRTLTHRTVTLTGFATPDGDALWYLTGIEITCCAADSRSYLVAVDGDARPPVANTWMRVTGTWVPSTPTASGAPTARIAATSLAPVAAPAEPYELP